MNPLFRGQKRIAYQLNLFVSGKFKMYYFFWNFVMISFSFYSSIVIIADLFYIFRVHWKREISEDGRELLYKHASLLSAQNWYLENLARNLGVLLSFDMVEVWRNNWERITSLFIYLFILKIYLFFKLVKFLKIFRN